MEDPLQADVCLHCAGPLPAQAGDAYCCSGCRFVHALLKEEGLERYYSLRGERGDAVTASREGRDQKWLEPLEASLAKETGITRIELDVQGLSCAACVWLIEQLFRREKGGVTVLVNPSLGRLVLTVTNAFPLRVFVSRVESCGYLLGPKLKREDAPSSALLFRMGVAIAIAMNGMILAISIYAGLSSGPIHQFFTWLSFALGTVSVLVGGSYFIKTAWQGLRQGLLHLDLPIALGIVLAYGSSTWAFFAGSSSTYFDTLSIFIAFMLVGRFLQMRLIERNQRRLLASNGAEGLFTRRLENGEVVLRRAVEVRKDDLLVLAPSDVLPVRATLEGEQPASFSLDWVNGESAPRAIMPREEVPAGAFLSGERAVTLRAADDFQASTLVQLLAAPQNDARHRRVTAYWRVFARVYVLAVLALAAIGFLIGFYATRDMHETLSRVTAILIVTCPCAFGIAAPLAYELSSARLRRAGLFIRSPSFLDHAALVRRLVFDKTGTLTTGKSRILDASPAASLDSLDRCVLKNLAARSPHPKSVAVSAALGADEFLAHSFDAREIPGLGLEVHYNGHHYKLGSSSFIDSSTTSEETDIAFGRDGKVLCSFRTAEDLRPDAADEVRALRAEGYEVLMLSGDGKERALRVAEVCDIPKQNVIAEKSAQGKADWVRAEDRGDMLFVGDGINDALVATEATVSGTPAIDRPFLATRTDFYLVTPGLGPIRLALMEALRLKRALAFTLSVALIYNIVTVGLAYTGLMTPLVCAIVMPLSSLSTIAIVLFALGDRADARVKTARATAQSSALEAGRGARLRTA